MNKVLLTATAGIILASFTPEQAAAASFTGIGNLGSIPVVGSASYSQNISGDGSTVVGGSYSPTTGWNEAFTWTDGTGITGIGSLPAVSAGTWSYANGASGDGSVVTGTSSVTVAGLSTSEAFSWTSGGGMVGLGDLAGGAFSSYGMSVSDDESTIVGNSSSISGIEAFSWTPGGGMVGLGDLAGGAFESKSLGVSADGSSIVGYSASVSGIEAFLWTSGGGMVGLGDLAGGAFKSIAVDVTPDGSVIVGAGSSAVGVNEAFIYTDALGMVSIGGLFNPDGTAANSFGMGVSADGATVIGYSKLAAGNKGFIWDSINGIRSVSDMLISEYGLGSALAGWQLGSASGISDDGLTISGTGINPLGEHEAWVARLDAPAAVPEPSTFLLLALGLTALAGCSKVRKRKQLIGS